MMSRKTKDNDFEQETWEAFKVVDRDNDGFISAAELRHLMVSIGEELTDEELDEIIKAGDQDGDGHISCERNTYELIGDCADNELKTASLFS